jgi:hypothetical protein
MRHELSVEQWPQTERKSRGAHLANRRRVATAEQPKNHVTEKRLAACSPLQFVQYDGWHNFWIYWQYLAIPPITKIGNYCHRTVFLCSFCEVFRILLKNIFAENENDFQIHQQKPPTQRGIHSHVVRSHVRPAPKLSQTIMGKHLKQAHTLPIRSHADCIPRRVIVHNNPRINSKTAKAKGGGVKNTPTPLFYLSQSLCVRLRVFLFDICNDKVIYHFAQSEVIYFSLFIVSFRQFVKFLVKVGNNFPRNLAPRCDIGGGGIINQSQTTLI